MSHLQEVSLTFENYQTRYPKEYRDWCFQLWATECKHNLVTLLERLEHPNDFDPPLLCTYEPPSKYTLQLWKRNETWDDRWVLEFRKIHRNKFDLTVTKIAAASEDAIDVLIKIMDPENDPDFRLVPARDRVAAAKMILDMGGHKAYELQKGDQIVAPPRFAAQSAAALSTDEIAKRIAARSQQAIERDADILDVRGTVEAAG